MTYDVRFLPEIEEDVISGYTWYEEKAPGLGEEFLRMFYACVGEIRRNPLISATVYRGIRRRLLRRFPYALYYGIEGNEITVFGFFHCARDPRKVATTLIKRGEPKIF